MWMRTLTDWLVQTKPGISVVLLGLIPTHLSPFPKSMSLRKGNPMPFPMKSCSSIFLLLGFGKGEFGGAVGKKELLGACMYGLYLHAGRCEAGFEPRSEDEGEGHCCVYVQYLFLHNHKHILSFSNHRFPLVSLSLSTITTSISFQENPCWLFNRYFISTTAKLKSNHLKVKV